MQAPLRLRRSPERRRQARRPGTTHAASASIGATSGRTASVGPRHVLSIELSRRSPSSRHNSQHGYGPRESAIYGQLRCSELSSWERDAMETACRNARRGIERQRRAQAPPSLASNRRAADFTSPSLAGNYPMVPPRLWRSLSGDRISCKAIFCGLGLRSDKRASVSGMPWWVAWRDQRRRL